MPHADPAGLHFASTHAASPPAPWHCPCTRRTPGCSKHAPALHCGHTRAPASAASHGAGWGAPLPLPSACTLPNLFLQPHPGCCNGRHWPAKVPWHQAQAGGWQWWQWQWQWQRWRWRCCAAACYCCTPSHPTPCHLACPTCAHICPPTHPWWGAPPLHSPTTCAHCCCLWPCLPHNPQPPTPAHPWHPACSLPPGARFPPCLGAVPGARVWRHGCSALGQPCSQRCSLRLPGGAGQGWGHCRPARGSAWGPQERTGVCAEGHGCGGGSGRGRGRGRGGNGGGAGSLAAGGVRRGSGGVGEAGVRG